MPCTHSERFLWSKLARGVADQANRGPQEEASKGGMLSRASVCRARRGDQDQARGAEDKRPGCGVLEKNELVVARTQATEVADVVFVCLLKLPV